MKLLNALVVATLLTCPAWGNSIILTGLHSSLGMQSSLTFDQDGVATTEFWAGAIDVTVDGYPRLLFCVDLFTTIGLNTAYMTQLDFSDSPQLKRVGWLLENELPSITTEAGGAGLQLAFWDIIVDNGDGFAAGSGRVTQSSDSSRPTDATALATAIDMETLSMGQSSTFGIVYHNVSWANGAPQQTLIGASIPDGGPQPTPEPESLFLMACGVVLIFASRRIGARGRNVGQVCANATATKCDAGVAR